MVATRGLVVIVVVLDKEGRIVGQRVDDTTSTLVGTTLEVLSALCGVL